MPDYFDSGLIRDEAAWHRKGNVQAGATIDAMTLEEACAAAGLDYAIEELPLVPQYDAVSCPPDQNPQTWEPKDTYTYGEPVSSHKALVNGTTGDIISVVGARYEPLQNIQAFQFFNPFLADGDAVIETAGSCKNGQIVWVMCKIQDCDPIEVVPGDVIMPYLTLGHGHDGKTPVHVFFQRVRVVCWNTWRMALGEAKASGSAVIKVRHTKNVLRNLDYVRDSIDLARRTFTESAGLAQAMARKELKVEGFKNYIEMVYQKTKVVEEKVLVSLDDGTVEEQTVRQSVAAMPQNYKELERLFEEGAGSQIKGVRGTVWGAFNAVTEYVDYYRGRSEDTRLTAAWYGPGSDLKDRAWEVAQSMV